jgi:hypothetical protein
LSSYQTHGERTEIHHTYQGGLWRKAPQYKLQEVPQGRADGAGFNRDEHGRLSTPYRLRLGNDAWYVLKSSPKNTSLIKTDEPLDLLEKTNARYKKELDSRRENWQARLPRLLQAYCGSHLANATMSCNCAGPLETFTIIGLKGESH